MRMSKNSNQRNTFKKNQRKNLRTNQNMKSQNWKRKNVGEMEDLDKMRDDLEATKQLLELEVRSKALLEKDNKRLQHEIERLKVEFANVKMVGTENQAPPDILNNILTRERKESISKERRDSMIEKRKSMADNQISDIIASSQAPNKVITEEVPEEVTLKEILIWL